MDPLLLEQARGIKLLALDVDGVLTDGRLYFDQQGNELKVFNTRDGLGMKAVQHFGVQLAIITARRSAMVTRRAEQLGVDFVFQGREKKLEAFRELLDKADVEAEAVCYCGDDLIDLPVLERVGLATAPADAHRLVRERVHYVTELGGGHGAVREVCDLILTAQGNEDRLLEEIARQ